LWVLGQYWENVFVSIRNRWGPKAKRDDSAKEFVAVVGLEGRRTSLSSTVVRWSEQRVGLGRALANEPTLSLCDEPRVHRPRRR